MRLFHVVATCTTLWASWALATGDDDDDDDSDKRCGAAEDEYGEDCCCEPGVCLETDFDTVHEIVPNKVWTVITYNPRGQTDYNRMIVFKIPPVADYDDDSLVLINGVDLRDSVVQGLELLETPVRWVISPGDWQWLYLDQYVRHFPDISVLVPPVRIPEQAGDSFNYTVMEDNSNPLSFLAPHILSGVIGGLRQPSGRAVRRELYFYHVETETLVIGDPIFYYSCGAPLVNRFVSPGLRTQRLHLWNVLSTTMFNDAEKMRESMDVVLELNFTRFIPIHGAPGSILTAATEPSAKEQLRLTLNGFWGPYSSPWILLVPILIFFGCLCFCADCLMASIVAGFSYCYCKPVVIEEEEVFVFERRKTALSQPLTEDGVEDETDSQASDSFVKTSKDNVGSTLKKTKSLNAKGTKPAAAGMPQEPDEADGFGDWAPSILRQLSPARGSPRGGGSPREPGDQELAAVKKVATDRKEARTSGQGIVGVNTNKGLGRASIGQNLIEGVEV